MIDRTDYLDKRRRHVGVFALILIVAGVGAIVYNLVRWHSFNPINIFPLTIWGYVAWRNLRPQKREIPL